MATFKCRQVDKYDGQSVFANGKVVYDLGNYLGGGASGSVYQAFDPDWDGTDRSVAIKILNPLGYKNIFFGNINQCPVVWKGMPMSSEAKAGMLYEHIWWLLHPNTKQVFAAFEDPQRKQLRELPLTKCVEIWGTNPLNIEKLSSEIEAEKYNFSGNLVYHDSKEYKIPLVSPKYLKFLKNRQLVCREMSNMVQIGEHPNIIELLEVLELIQDSKTTLFLVLDLVNGGELFDRMKAGIHGNQEEFARRYFKQLVSGLEYCHKRGIVHRDLKPENLLLSDPSDTAILKIADFGLSAVIFAAESTGHSSPPEVDTTTARLNYNISNGQLSPGARIPKVEMKTSGSKFFSTPTKPAPLDTSPTSFRRLKSVVGSPHYTAPEIISDDPAGYDGRKVDMWSTGVILYSLFTGSLPFGSDLSSCPRYKRYKQWVATDYQVMQRDGKDIVPPSWFWSSHISPLVSGLLVGLLQSDPSQRLSAAEAMNHPWCQGVTYEEYKASLLVARVELPSSARANTYSTVNRLCTSSSRSNSPERLDAVPSPPSPPPNSEMSTKPPMIPRPTYDPLEDHHKNFETRFQMPYQYDRAAMLEQQRQKEAEALDLCSRQLVQTRINEESTNQAVSGSQPPRAPPRNQQSNADYDLQL